MWNSDFEAVIYHGTVYCSGCMPKSVSLASEQVYPIFAGTEVDSYPVCDACGREHDYMVLNQYRPVASLGDEG
jgi:hypothetical protein